MEQRYKDSFEPEGLSHCKQVHCQHVTGVHHMSKKKMKCDCEGV